MKKASLIVMALFVVASVIGVMVIEKNRKSPQDRFLETSQTVKQTDGYVPVKILNNEGNLQYEFLSYEFVDDKDIEKQTKYKAEYFIEGKVPPSDYVVKWTDFDAMARDYPKFDEWRKSDCSKGMTEGEYEEFMRIHEPEYTIDKHVKTKYLFVKCRITYIGGGRKKVPMDDFNLFFMCGNDYRGSGDIDCYFDHPQPALWEDSSGVHMLLRSTFGRILRSDSLDEGQNWCKPYAVNMPNNNSGIATSYYKDTLFLACNPVADNWGARTPMTLFTSENGIDFKEAVVLETQKAEFSYPCLYVLNNSLYISYTSKRTNIRIHKYNFV